MTAIATVKSAWRMRSVVVFSVLAVAASVLVPHYASRIGAAAPAPAAPGLRPSAATATGLYSRTVVIPRDNRGHFEVDARIGGRQLNFMVDTGASVVALTASDAARLGIRPAPAEFVAEVRTANGTVRAAPTQLDAIEVGDLRVRDVAALVLPDGALSDNLLGLSFLSRLRRFEYSDGRLVLEQ
jgi:aspartyl protease family protein